MTPEWDRREASPSSSVGSDVSVADARFEGFGGGAAERRGEPCESSGARTRGLGAAAPAARRAPSLLRRLFSASAAPSTSGETLKTSSSLASVASAGSSPGDGSAPASESLCTSALLYSASVLRGEVHMQSDSECAMLIAADTAHRHAHAAAARAAEAAARRGGAQHQRPDGENHSASTQHTKPEASRASTDPLTIPSSHARTVVRGGRVVCDNEVLCGQCKVRGAPRARARAAGLPAPSKPKQLHGHNTLSATFIPNAPRRTRPKLLLPPRAPRRAASEPPPRYAR